MLRWCTQTDENLLLLDLLGIVMGPSVLMLRANDKQAGKLLAIVSSEFVACVLAVTNCHLATYDRLLLVVKLLVKLSWYKLSSEYSCEKFEISNKVRSNKHNQFEQLGIVFDFLLLFFPI